MRWQAKTRFARKLRHQMTDAEQRLWFQLRLGRLAGCRFRQQHPVGRYIADFACLEAGLIIEVDGGQHLESAGDKARDEWFSTQGFRVLRFWDDDVLLRTDEMTAVILEALAPSGPHPPSAPSPASGGRKRN
ncbi:MAG: endonuclease domain-containing protein [Rhodanobacteraceae bacterium]